MTKRTFWVRIAAVVVGEREKHVASTGIPRWTDGDYAASSTKSFADCHGATFPCSRMSSAYYFGVWVHHSLPGAKFTLEMVVGKGKCSLCSGINHRHYVLNHYHHLLRKLAQCSPPTQHCTMFTEVSGGNYYRAHKEQN